MRTANDLIVDALYFCGEYAPDELPTAAQIQRGLITLNELLDNFSATSIYIPLTTQINFVTTSGKADYTVSDDVPADINSPLIIQIEFGSVSQDGSTLIYPVKPINRTQLFDNTRYTGVALRPGYVLLENQSLVSTVTLVPTPDINYNITLRVKQQLDELGLLDFLDEVPKSSQRFLKYALARELCNTFPSANWTAAAEEEYQNLYQRYRSSNDIDMQVRVSDI